MTTPDKSLIERVQKILARAEDPSASPAERDLCNAKATELMLKHSIDEAMLGIQGKIEEIIRRHLKLDFIPAAYTHEYAVLGVNIARFMNCTGFRMTLPKRTDLCFVGYSSDVESLELLYWSLMRQCMFSLTAWYGSFDTKRELFQMTPQDKMAAKKSYVVGFINGVVEKLESVRKQLLNDVGHGAELALIDRKTKVDSWLDENLKLSAGRPRRYAPNGRLAGFQAGYDADIGQPKMGLNRRAIGPSS